MNAKTEPKQNESLKPLGQEKAWETLVAMRDALPQSLILLGPAGVGKRQAAKALYQLIHCRKNTSSEDAGADLFGGGLFGAPEAATPSSRAVPLTEPCGECVSCRKIAEGKHPDVVELLPKGESVAVDDLREMKKMLFFAPMEGRFRFVIIDEAHKLNAASANTLLKTLEEPPAHTRFFLVTHERALLLPTIISRSQFLSFSPLPNEILEQLLAKLEIEIPQPLLPTCLDLMGGGLARAALFADEKVLAFLDMTQRALQTSRNSRAQSWEAVARLADDLGAEDWMLELFLDILVRLGHREALANPASRKATTAAELALEASYLRRRLDRYANKKLIALAAAQLSQTH